jgi:hypothetical protein
MTTPLFIGQTMPGSSGEHDLQERYGTRSRVEAFFKHQVLSSLVYVSGRGAKEWVATIDTYFHSLRRLPCTSRCENLSDRF